MYIYIYIYTYIYIHIYIYIYIHIYILLLESFKSPFKMFLLGHYKGSKYLTMGHALFVLSLPWFLFVFLGISKVWSVRLGSLCEGSTLDPKP